VAKVLVIDDSSFQRKWIAKSVQALGHSTVEAADGQEGLDSLDREQPDCITVDLNMPNMDGLEFLTNLSGRPNVPAVIVVTADVQEETKNQCRELGARGFLNKPFRPSQLQELLAECLGTEE
jgi:twitching motility two-component system response regulator PilH